MRLFLLQQMLLILNNYIKFIIMGHHAKFEESYNLSNSLSIAARYSHACHRNRMSVARFFGECPSSVLAPPGKVEVMSEPLRGGRQGTTVMLFIVVEDCTYFLRS